MPRPATLLLVLFVLLTSIGVPRVSAQSASSRGRLIVTVNDATGGFLPTATVTLAGAQPAKYNIPLPRTGVVQVNDGIPASDQRSTPVFKS